jgi:WD40 repeat protein
MIVGGENGVIRFWNILENKNFGQVMGTLAYHMRPVHDVALNPFNEDQLASCSEDGQFAIWSVGRL